jgi:pimeloyl-ACP methyl ester carboxylesterase/DNA-binding CsgD family transcriptional regulator
MSVGSVLAEPHLRVPPVPEQEIRFARGQGGARVAWAKHGSGPPLVVVSCWLSHLQHDWHSPVWRHFLDDLGQFVTLVRYDERGFGMSDWNVTDFSLEARVADFEAVVDATGYPQVALLGMSSGSAVAMAYAARHPGRVTRLVLHGTVPGRPATFETDAAWDEEQTWRSMIRVGWAKEHPVFRRTFTQGFIPGANENQMRWFDELQRMASSPENIIASRIAKLAVDIRAEMQRITAPTLILQAVGDAIVDFGNALEVIELIPHARLVALDSVNHILLADEPAWPAFLDEVRAFMEPDRRAAGAFDRERQLAVETLSARELDVLRAAALGLDNEAIAADLGLSVRTVERHLSNSYGKLGLNGRAARAAAVAEVLRRGLA